jgi:hypothetical protein
MISHQRNIGSVAARDSDYTTWSIDQFDGDAVPDAIDG